MDSKDPNETLMPKSPKLKKTRASFIEEEDTSKTPRITRQPATPPAISIPGVNGPPVTVTSPHFMSSPSAPTPALDKQQRAIVADLVPDLHGLAPKKGLSTELENHDSALARERVSSAETKSSTHMPGSFIPLKTSRIPDWYRTGWTSLSNQKNPGGALDILATTKRRDRMDDLIPNFLYGEWYHNGAALFLTALVSFILAKLNAGVGTIVLFCLCIASYYRTSTKRFRRNTRDDIQREISKFKLEADEESVEWMNSFIHKFWLIFEPVLSALIVENLDNYISDYLPPYLDSIRLTTFTLGTKPFRIETVKTYLGTDADSVCMDWRVSFTPNDLEDLTEEELDYKVNPRVIMNARVGGRRVGAGVPVLLEDMAFAGHLRMKIKFFSRFPFVKLIEASFLEKPDFDYVLKPMGTDSFGFDVNVIPGLSSFIREQVHHILGPLMYYPNVFSFQVDKFFDGEYDFNAVNGILAVTVYSADNIKHVDDLIDGPLDTYVRFYLDHSQELDRTEICEQSVSPAWNETRYLKIHNLDSLLSLELRLSRPGLKDRRLGTANFELSLLKDENLAEQEGLSLAVLRNGKQVSDLRVDIRYLPISNPIKREDGSVEPSVQSNSGILRLTIHECRELKSTNNKISPYVRLIINGTEKKRSATMKRKTNPKYEEHLEIIVLDKTNFFIRTEIRDADEDDLLGAFSSYLTDMLRLQEKNESWWDVALGDDKTGQVRLSAEWKPVLMSSLSDYVAGHGFEEPPIGVVRFTFWEARDLRNVEMVTNGKSDPYVRVLSGHQVRGRTEVIDNNLNPEWGETLYIPVHSLKENLVLEVVDWNAKTRDKTLGSTEFKITDIVRQMVGDQSVNPDIWYESNGVAVDRWSKLKTIDGRNSKGDLHYSAEFFPTLAVPQIPATETQVPMWDLHSSPIRYTPDRLVDLSSYNSGVLKIKIHEVQFSSPVYCYCQVIVDSLLPSYKTAKLRGQNLQFDETSDAFIKEADFSRIAIEIKSAHTTEKDIHTLGHWMDSGASIIRRIIRRKRYNPDSVDDEGFWFNLMGTGSPARIRLSFDYIPMSNFLLNPDESLDNQGILNVDLLSAHDLKAADKSGTSDPYVIFTVNGEKVHRSEMFRKTLNPKWTGERFSVPIQSRVTASIRIEVFDWNHVRGHQPIGSGGITLRGDAVQSFEAKIVDIPLDGVAGVSGFVRVKFTWHPQLLAHKKVQTTVMSSNKTYLYDDINLEASGPLQSAVDDALISPTSPSVSGGRPSFENTSSVVSNDDTISMAPSSIADTNVLSDATGRAGIVNITLVEARGLRGVDKSGTSDPFVRVKVGKRQVYKTKVIHKTLLPEWNETFTHGVGGEPFMFDFKVKDHNKIKSAVDLGQSRVNIWDLIKVDIPGGDTFNQWLPLFPPGSGELLVNIKFNPTM